MKVNTITCHCPHNFGAVLQAYALQNHIEKDNHEVKIIDYRPNYLTKQHTLIYVGNQRFKSLFFLRWLYILMFLPSRIRRIFNFRMFERKYLKLSAKKYLTYGDLAMNPPEADLYICGSDQIWNPNLPNGKDESYYLSFVKEGEKKASYAASMSIVMINEEQKKFISDRILNFKAISVREDSAKTIVSSVVPREITQVLDPVLLLSQAEWSKLSEKSNIRLREKYILLYIMGDDPRQILEIATKLAQEKKVKLFLITNSLKKYVGVDKYFRGASPHSFLHLIKNAEHVITNSFHGVVFSIIFNKQFIPCHIKNTNTRINSILSLLNLTDLYQESENKSSTIPLIHYETVNETLDKEIKKSKAYLSNLLRS